MSEVQPVSIDFGALKQPDYLGSYVNAFQVGRQLAGQQIQGNAMQGGDPESDARTAIAAMTPAQRALGARSAEILATLGVGLRGVPYPARRSVLDHLTPALATQGLGPATVAAFDPTDGNLDAHVALAQSLGQMFAHGD